VAETKFGKPQDLLPKKPAAAVRPGKDDAEGAKEGKPDGRLNFAAGDTLFSQGDPGGDLFFIESGVVEIYTQRGPETVVLSEMTTGEIIGVMTCMTSEPRMASARAKTAVVCKKVPHASIKKVISALPNWMKIVLKEFTIRLTQMNKAYSEAVVKIKKLEGNQISNVYVGALLASAFGALAEHVCFKQEDAKYVVVEELMLKLETVLNMKKEDLDRIFAVLLEAGLVKIEIEPEKKRTVVRLENAQKLLHFAQFVRESKTGATKKLVRARFSHKETRVLSAIVKLAARLDMDLDKTCKLTVAEVARSLERATGVKFEREALDKAEKLKLLSIEGEAGEAQIVMKPSHLGRTIACVEAVRKLTALDTTASSPANSQTAA
jgi:hypothetical protein